MKIIVLSRENGKEGICGICGKFSHFLRASIQYPAGTTREVEFETCCNCLSSHAKAQQVFAYMYRLPAGYIVFALQLSDLIEKKRGVICCQEIRSDLGLPQLPRQLLRTGYLYPCSCGRKYF